jgi:hypothetical protein
VTFGPAPQEQENYDSPILRKLVDIWDEYDSEEIDQEDVLDALDRIEQLTLDQLESMEEGAKCPEVDILEPNRIAIIRAFEDHIAALEKMRDFFFVDTPGLVEDAFDMLQHATNQLIRGAEGILTEHDLPPKLCMHCSSPNSRAARKCAACEAILPIIEKPRQNRLLAIAGPEYVVEPSYKTTPNYIEMADGYDDWIFGDITYQDFLNLSKRIRNRYRAECNSRFKALELSRERGEADDYLAARVEVVELNVDIMDWLIQALEAQDFPMVDKVMHRLDQANNALVEIEEERE